MARILVAGATGHLGRFIVSELKKRNHWVRALTRNPMRPYPEVDDLVGGDINLINTLQRPCGEVDVIISTVGASINPRLFTREPDYWHVDYEGNRNLLRVAGTSGIRKFLYVSVYSVPALQHLDYIRAHAKFSDELKASGLSYAIVKPTGFFSAYGAMLELAKLGVAPLLGDGSARTNPIHESDLARVVADALESSNCEISVGGPEVLSRRRIGELAFEALGKKPRFVPIPESMVTAQIRIMSRFDPRVAQITAFLKKVSQVDAIAPATGTERLADYFGEKAAVMVGA